MQSKAATELNGIAQRRLDAPKTTLDSRLLN